MNDAITDKDLEEAVAHFRKQILPAAKSAEPSAGLSGRILEAVSDEAFFGRVRRRAATLEPSPSLTARIMGAVVREHRRTRCIRIAIATAAGVAAILAIAFVSPLFTDDSSVNTAAPTVSLAPQMASDAADWLVAQQCTDGTWSPMQTGGNEAFRPALTALALMALQRHAPIRHAEAIARAEKALEKLQTADGAFSSSPSSKLYNHAFATFALLSLQNARHQGLTPTIQRAVAFSLGRQNHLGAWDYTVQEPGNTALTVWELGVLMEARKAGWDDADGHLRKGLAWLRKRGHDGVFDYREAFDRQYTPHAGSLTLTAMATSTLLEAAETFPGLRTTASNAVESLRLAYKRSAEHATSNHYRDYFLCRAFREETDAGIPHTIADAIATRYSQTASRTTAPWAAKDAWASTGGDLYATVMAMLSVRRG